MTVKALPPTPETAPGVALGKFRSGFKAPLDPARSILLDADIQQWIVDEDAGQILALAPKEGQLLQVSIGEKKLLRSIPTGERPVALCFAAGTTKAVWVANEGSASLVKVDLEKGQVTETIPLSAGTPKAVVAVRKYLWWLEEHGSIQGLDLSDKRDLKQLGSETSSALLYDAKRDRLLSASGYHFIDFDASKVGLILRELTRKNLDPRTAGELAAGMAKATKVTETSALQDRLDSGRMLLDEKNGRLYVGKVGLKIDKLEAVLRAYTTSAHPMLSTGDNPYAGGNKTLEEIRAASADGKWVASGTHVFNAAGGAVHKELPLPCLLVAFSKDSKQLAYFDRANGAIVTIDVEPK
jgi:hypothetical protein